MTDALISRDVLFGNPDKAMARLSPDGAFVAFLAPDEGVLNVFVAPTDDLSAAEVVTADRGRGVRVFSWAYDNRHLVYLQDEGGDENWRVYSVDVTTKGVIDLTPLQGVAAQIVKASHRHPETILVGLNDRDPRWHDVYRVSLETGERELVQQNDGYTGFLCDDDLAIRLALEPTPSGGQRLLEKKGDAFELLFEIARDDALTTHPIGFDASGEHVRLLDSRGRDKAALASLRLRDGALEIISADDRADVSDALLHPTTKEVQAVCATYLRNRWTFLDDDVAKDFSRLAEVARGDILVTSRTLDDRRWTVAFATDDGPVRSYVFDRDSGEATFLFSNRAELEDVSLTRMRPVEIASRDGLTLVSYVSLPRWSGETPEAPLPMVLLVHGGPWARDAWGFDPHHQWLTNRGYAVLSVNFRGSTGFGKGFINAGDGEWSGKMHDDLIDAVRWAIDEGIADPERIAIMGGSYGGYATLVGLTFTPEVFACGVDIVGPSNLLTLLESVPPYWEAFRATLLQRVGDPGTPEGEQGLRDRSPLFRAERIQRPLLIGQGANDPRVKQAEADQIVGAMKDKKIPVTYALYPDEGHGFARPENRKSFNAITEAFLAEVLGGRVEPIGEDFAGASVEVPEGASFVTGLSEALS